MEEDEVLSKITRLLEKGCTMLATHHDCGAPLFRCRGEVVCPVCSFADEPSSAPGGQQLASPGAGEDEKANSDRAHLPESEKIGRLNAEAKAKPARKDEQNDEDLKQAKGRLNAEAKAKPAGKDEQNDEDLKQAKGSLHAALLHRLREITAALEEENDLDKLKKQLDCLEGLLRVFRSMRE